MYANRTFKRGSGCYTCRDCKKQTRETGEGESGVELCRKCFNDAGNENHHNDNCDQNVKREDCPSCIANGYV